MTVPADNSGPTEGARHEPFYEHRAPLYPCPACSAGVLLPKQGTLHFGQCAESRALYEAVGPEIGEGRWRFACLFECCATGCRETVACIGDMSWARDPRLPQEPGEPEPADCRRSCSHLGAVTGQVFAGYARCQRGAPAAARAHPAQPMSPGHAPRLRRH